MELTLINSSIVVLSEGNNPRLLNHDFLVRNDIVPAEWTVKDVLVTPPLAQVTYENGVQFWVEIGKIQILVTGRIRCNGKTRFQECSSAT